MQECTEFNWFGTRVRVRADSEALCSLVDRVWGRLGAKEPAAAVRSYAIRLNGPGAPIFDGPSGRRAVDSRQPLWHAYNLLLDDLLGLVGEHFLFHAAALARDGRALVVQGPSTFGKTTLALHLIERGFRLLSDDVTVLERASGRVLPLRRAVTLRAGARETLGPGLLSRARGAVRAVDGDDWVVDPAAWLGPPAEPSRIALVAILRSGEDGDGIRRFPGYEIRVASGEEDRLDGLARLPGVRHVDRVPGQPWVARALVDDSTRLTEWLAAERDRIVSVIKLPSAPADFSNEPTSRSLGPFQTALELVQEMLNRQDGGRLAMEFRGREPELVADVAAALRGARCRALSPGRLDRMVDLLVKEFEGVKS